MKLTILVLAAALLPTAAMAQDYLSEDSDGNSTYYSTLPDGSILATPGDPTDTGGGTYYVPLPGGTASPMPGTTPNGEAPCDPGFCAGQ